MANPVTNWTDDPAADPADTFATPSGMGSTATCDWDLAEDVITGRNYRIEGQFIQCISDYDTEHGKKINQMVTGTAWTGSP
jgi:hypothetical protein